MIRRPPRSTLSSSSAASDVYKRQVQFTRERSRPRAGYVEQAGRLRRSQRNPRRDRSVTPRDKLTSYHCEEPEKCPFSVSALKATRESLQGQRVYDIDVTGVFLSCQAQGRAMLRNGGGSIVNIASMSGTIANRDLLQVHYNSAKAAVKHFTKSLAVEWAPSNIRVNSISPGYTATPMN